MATEVVEIATESEEDVINWVAIFYEEGKEDVNSLRDKKVTIP